MKTSKIQTYRDSMKGTEEAIDLKSGTRLIGSRYRVIEPKTFLAWLNSINPEEIALA